MLILKRMIKPMWVICSLFAVYGIIHIILGEIIFPESNIIGTDTAICVCVAASLFLLYLILKKIPRSRISDIIFILCAALIVTFYILVTPYTPCNDALDLHNTLKEIINDNLSVYYKTYMNFWFNNRITVYMYLPFVRIAGGVAEGVRLLNGILLIGIISCLTLTIYNFSEKKLWREPMILLSLMAPAMCLTGPYIYPLSIFFASAAMLCFSFDKIPAWIGFIFISAMLYVLRPTCAGFILAFTVIYGVLHTHSKRKMLFLIGSAAVIIVCGTVLKSATGGILYKTGAYKYKEINDSAMLWTFELGTRNEGAYTGQCTYSAFGIDEDEHDKIKNDFGQLSLRYYYDEICDVESYDEITRLHAKIQTELKDRVKHLFFSADLFPHILYKSANFYGNVYLPYYCRVNLTALDKPELDLDRIFFTYHNVILLMFFIITIISTIMELVRQTRQSALRLSLIISSFAVQWLMILITEVSKKYIFDFYVPMMLTIGLFLSSFTCKTAARINIVLPMFALAAILDIFLMRQYISPQLGNMKVQLTTDSDTEVCSIDFGHPISKPGWTLIDYYGKDLDLYDLQYAEVQFPKNTFNAFRIVSPNGRERIFSAQPIDEPE